MRSHWVQQSAYLLTFVVLLGMGRECLRLPEIPFLGMSMWGSEVTQVRPGSPAAQAGLRAGDRLETLSGSADLGSVDVRTLSSPLASLKDRGTRPSRLVLKRQGARIWAELVPRRLSSGEHALYLGLAVASALLLLLGAFTFVHGAGVQTASFVALCLVLSMLLSPFAQDAATGGTRFLWTNWPGDRTGLLLLVFAALVLGVVRLRRREDPLKRAELERLALRWLIYLAFAGAFVILYFVGFLGLRLLLGGVTISETQLGVGFVLAFFALILSPPCERMISSLDRSGA